MAYRLTARRSRFRHCGHAHLDKVVCRITVKPLPFHLAVTEENRINLNSGRISFAQLESADGHLSTQDHVLLRPSSTTLPIDTSIPLPPANAWK